MHMANTQNDVQIGVGMDATGVQRSAETIESTVKKMAGNVAKEGERAGKGVEAIGSGSEKAAREVERSERSIIASIQRRTAVVEAAGKGERAYQEALLNNRGLDPARFKPYLDQLEAAERAQRVAANGLDNMGLSAKQTAAALRGVPAQFTDIATALQGGQKPLTVFLQQGGQLKDMFGGAGAAAKAMGGYVLGLISPLSLGAAALGAIAYGYDKGASEGQAFARTLINTGNAAGTTAAQLGQMANSLDAMSGATRGQAADALNQMAASGKVGAANLQRFTQAALELERSGGQAIQKTVEAFADLGRDPLKASVKLNEAMNYLTRSTYEQIKAAEDQGRTTDAAKLAQEAYANALAERAPQLEKQLGYVERAWRGIKDASKEALDGLASIGRPTSELDTIGTAVTATRARIAQIQTRGAGVDNQRALAARERELAVLLQQQGLLQEQERLVRRSADAQAEQARQVRLLSDYQKDGEKYLASNVQLNRAITREIVQGVAAGEKMKVIQDRVAALRKQREGKGDGGAARELEAEADLLAKLTGYTASYNNEVARLVSLRNKGKISEQQYGDEVRKLVALQPGAVKEAKALAAAEEATAAAYKKVIGELDGVLSRQEREVQTLQDQYIAMTAGKEVLEQVRAAREGNALAMAEEALQTAYLTGATDAEIVRRKQIIEKLQEEIALRKGLAAAIANKEVDDANTKAAEKATQEWERAADQIGQSLADALMQGGKSAGEYIKGLFRTMVLRPIIQGVVQPYANAVTSFLGGNTGQGATGQAGQYLQGAQSLQTLYGYGQSGYGYLAANGYLGGSAAYTAAADSALATSGNYYAGSAAASSSSAAGGASMASYAGWAALAAVIYSKGMADYEAGFRRDQARETGTVAGRVTADTSDLLSKLGVSDKWADFFGATAVAATIGRAAPQVTGSGIQGSLGGGRFTGTGYADIYEKGGFLRSGNAYQSLSALPDDLARFMDEAAKGVLDKAKEFGDALGLPVTALESVTTTLKLNLGDTLGNNEQDIKDALAAYGNALVAGWAEALRPVAIYGESTIQTIDRVGAAIKGTNDVLGLLDIGMLEASVAGGQAAAALAAAFGSLDNLTQASAAYYQNYFTEAERSAKATEQLSLALAGVGLALPASRDQFRSLVEGLDLATEAGRNQFLVLMSVQQAFSELNPVLEESAAVAESATNALKERAALELELMRVQGDTAGIRARERAELDASNQALYDQIRALEDTQAAANQAADAAAQAANLAADAAEAANQRLRAIADEKNGLELQLLQLQGNTAEIRVRERAALLSDEARLLYDQVKALEDAGKEWQNVTTAATSAASEVNTAWTSVWAGIAEEVRRLRGGGQAASGTALLADFATTTAQARAGDAGAAGRLAGIARGLSDAGQNTTATRAEFDTLNGKLAASLEKTLLATGAPADVMAGLRTDMQGLREDSNLAAAQSLTLLRRVSQLLDKFDAEGLPEVRT